MDIADAWEYSQEKILLKIEKKRFVQYLDLS